MVKALYIDPKLDMIFKKIPEYQKNFSSLVRNALFDYIKNKKLLPINELNIIDIEKRKERNKGLDYMEEKLNFEEKISKNLFKWIFKQGRRDSYDKKMYIEYIEKAISCIEEKEIVDWLNDCLIKIKSENWDNLDININKRKDEWLFYLLKGKGYSNEVTNDIIKGSITVKEIKEKVYIKEDKKVEER